MNRILFATVFFIFLSLQSAAQINIGVQGGGNLSKMDFTNNLDYRYLKIEYTSGFIGGLSMQFFGDKHAGIMVELNYSQRGWIVRDTLGANDTKETNRMTYVEMPVLTHVNIGGGKLRGLFNIGPYIGYALSRSYAFEDYNSGEGTSYDYTFDEEKDNRLDFGLLAGGGIEYRFGFGKLQAEARYTIGFGDVDKMKKQQAEVSQFRIIGVLLRVVVPITKPKTERQ